VSQKWDAWPTEVNVGHNCFLPCFSEFIVHNHPAITYAIVKEPSFCLIAEQVGLATMCVQEVSVSGTGQDTSCND
jgi:hypothetical protein